MSAAEIPPVAQTTTLLAIGLVPLRVHLGRLEVLLVDAPAGPSLPRGAPAPASSLEDEAAAIADRLVGLPGTALQLGAFGRPSEGVSIAFLFLVRPAAAGADPRKGSAWHDWQDVAAVPPGRRDGAILAKAIERLRHDVEHGTPGFLLVDEEFTVSELRRVHESIRQVELDPSNFRKRVANWAEDGIVEELGTTRPTPTRPARLYRLRG